MSTNPQKQKRVTKQVRLKKELHILLKLRAIEDGKTISQLLDEICGEFFDKPS